jgi:hypothetical protein
MVRAGPVTAVLAGAAGFIIGLVIGWALTTSYALAAISRYQQRMQRKVRYWQAQTARARTEADRLTHLLESHGLQSKPGSWEEQQ